MQTLAAPELQTRNPAVQVEEDSFSFAMALGVAHLLLHYLPHLIINSYTYFLYITLYYCTLVLGCAGSIPKGIMFSFDVLLRSPLHHHTVHMTNCYLRLPR